MTALKEIDGAASSSTVGDAIDHLVRAEIAYIDSAAALRRAWKLGLRPEVELRTTSPALIDDPNLGAVQADARLTSDIVWALDAAFAAMSRDCRGRFGHEDLDLIAARYVTLEFQAIVGKAAMLDSGDFERSVAIVTLSAADAYLDSIVRTPLIRILRDNSRLATVCVPIDDVSRDDPRAPAPDFWRRLAFSSVRTLFYRTAERLTRVLGLRGPKGTILMIRENELSKETASALVFRGYLPRALSLLRISDPPPLDAARADALQRTCEALCETHLSRFLCQPALRAVQRILVEDVAWRARRYDASLAAWQSRLAPLARYRPRAVLTNRINDPELIGLHAVLRRRGIPLIGFQHGVTVEINHRMSQYDAQYESAFCDLELTFNERAAATSQANSFRRGRAVAVGLPREYFRGVRKGRLPGAPPIWYVSGAIYVGNHGQLEGTTDWMKCEHERSMVDRVLARLRHRVLYKPYPGRRFEDPDPVLRAAEAARNVEIYEGRLDLRYIVGSARLLISSRSFSTPSWCLTTGIPLVHIDIPEQDPLSSDARRAFEEGIFLFDAGAADFHDSLRRFLDQPLEAIERKWQQKKDGREALIREFVSPTRHGAGRRAADAIIAEIGRHSGS